MNGCSVTPRAEADSYQGVFPAQPLPGAQSALAEFDLCTQLTLGLNLTLTSW